ncbi:MAG: spore germination protein GerW family protein [bacterium]|nr:spore germination protein GerW family protein [bacterium]
MDKVKESLLQDFLPQLKELIRSETVFGAPYEVGGVTIIPVNSVKMGFGFGNGEITKDRDGGGGGGGVLLTPEAFLVVKNGEVSIHNLASGSIENIMDRVPEVLDKLVGVFERAKGKPKKESDPSS